MGLSQRRENNPSSGPARYPAAITPWPPGSPKVPTTCTSLCILAQPHGTSEGVGNQL